MQIDESSKYLTRQYNLIWKEVKSRSGNDVTIDNLKNARNNSSNKGKKEN